jgi:hypothetical protein
VQDVRFTLRPSRARLWFALAAQAGAGLVLVWIALAVGEAGVVLRVACAVAGGLLLWGLRRLRDAGSRALVLTEAGLADTRHGPLCGLADIVRVERGVFAFKPARGFALRLAAPGPRRWVPGLWWRMGRTIGVGGLTGAGETRIMGEMIEAMVAARSRDQTPEPPSH